MAEKPLHPIIVELVRSNKSLRDIIAAGGTAGDELVEAAAGMVATSNEQEKEALAAALKRAAAVDLSKQDPAVAIVFLHLWAANARASDRRDEIAAIANLAKTLVTPDMPREVRAEARAIECRLAEADGDWARSAAIQKSVSELLTPESPRYVRSLSPWVIIMAITWRLDEARQELAALEAHPDFADHAKLARLIWLCETCQIDEAVRVRRELEPRAPLRGLVPLWNLYHGICSLMSEPPDAADIVPHNRAAITTALLLRRPEQALEMARHQVAEHMEVFLVYPEYFVFDLIRAELASGNGEAARRWLSMRRERRNFHPLDDFYMARIELLAGNWPAAVRHYSVALEAVRRLHAEPRLEFELRQALELSPGDLLRLMREAAGAGGATAAASRREDGAAAAAGSARPRGLRALAGPSAVMEALRRSVEKLAALDAPVLITGETGTGKELVARALHESGPRSGEPFIAVNCGAISESLLESELFGHEKGAFTGAHAARVGIFETAGRGTVLLDEIGDIPPRLQVALLRVLESGEIRRVGASAARRVECRILAATNADLEKLVRDGRFRQDLLFRLRRLELALVPLRERREDILPLVDLFLNEGRAEGRRPVISAELRRALTAADWPGNVRELRNRIERMRLLNSDKLAYELVDFAGPAAAAPAEVKAADSKPVEPGAPAAAATTVGGWAAPEKFDEFLRSERSALRRLERVRELFRRHRTLTRAELARFLDVSGETATRDLRALCGEGFIHKVEPNRSPRTHYFALAEGAK